MSRLITLLFFLTSISSYSQEINHHTQIGRGLGNSAPAIISMILEWYNTPVSLNRIRSIYSNRLWRLEDSFDEIKNILVENNVNAYFEDVMTIYDLLDYVFYNNTVIIVFLDIQHIDIIAGRYYGRTHYYEGPHYIILYDFFADTFQVHDPILYGDSRLYKIDQVWRALREKRIIVVEK